MQWLHICYFLVACERLWLCQLVRWFVCNAIGKVTFLGVFEHYCSYCNWWQRKESILVLTLTIMLIKWVANAEFIEEQESPNLQWDYRKGCYLCLSLLQNLYLWINYPFYMKYLYLRKCVKRISPWSPLIAKEHKSLKTIIFMLDMGPLRLILWLWTQF